MSTSPRERILQATFDCVARYGIAKTAVEDVARQARVSRATVYRNFPGGKGDLIRETVMWEAGRVLERLAAQVAGTSGPAEMLSELLVFGRQAIVDHEVLQKVLDTEPERLLPALTGAWVVEMAAALIAPALEGVDLREGVDPAAAARLLARMVMSHIAAPGSWDLTDRDHVRELVDTQLLPSVTDDTVRRGSL